MLYFHPKETFFVHIPKTAGGYVLSRLHPLVYRQHKLSSDKDIKYFTQTNWKQTHYYSFATIRHPLERALSAWFYLIQAEKDIKEGLDKTLGHTLDLDVGEREWVFGNCKDLLEFSSKLELLCSQPKKAYHILPQHWWVDGPKGLRVHDVYKSENIEQSLPAIQKQTGSSYQKHAWHPHAYLHSGSWSAEMDYFKILKDHPQIKENITKFYIRDFRKFDYPFMLEDKVKREYLEHCNKAGIVIGTYGTPQFIHLQLANIRKLEPDVPVLVVDDNSPDQDAISDLCRQYGAEFICNPKRYEHWQGDLNVYIQGLQWAKRNNIDLLLKLSRRRIFLEPVISNLLKQANRCRRLGVGVHWILQSPGNTISINTSFLALKTKPWLLALPKMEEKLKQTKSNEVFCMEKWMLVLGMWLHEQVFAKKVAYPFQNWNYIYDCTLFKWHPKQLYDLSCGLNLNYVQDDFDQRFGARDIYQQYEATRDMWEGDISHYNW